MPIPDNVTFDAFQKAKAKYRETWHALYKDFDEKKLALEKQFEDQLGVNPETSTIRRYRIAGDEAVVIEVVYFTELRVRFAHQQWGSIMVEDVSDRALKVFIQVRQMAARWEAGDDNLWPDDLELAGN